MELISIKSVDGYYIIVDTLLDGKKIKALLDTGSTAVVVNEKHLKKDKKITSIVDIGGVGGVLKAKQTKALIEINGILKNINILASSFDVIHELCNEINLDKYDMIIGLKQVFQYNLQESLYNVIRNK